MGGSAGLALGAAARTLLCAATMPHITETPSGQSLPPDVEPPVAPPPPVFTLPPLLALTAVVPPRLVIPPALDAGAPPEPTLLLSFAPQPNAVTMFIATKIPSIPLLVNLLLPTGIDGYQCSASRCRRPMRGFALRPCRYCS